MKVLKKLQHPLALVIQGFLVGGVLFWTTQGQATQSAPLAIVSTREKGPRFAEMEQSVEWTMKFASGIIASCRSSYGANGENRVEVNGDRGNLIRHSENDVEVLAVEKFCLATFDPLCTHQRLTLVAMSIAA